MGEEELMRYLGRNVLAGVEVGAGPVIEGIRRFVREQRKMEKDTWKTEAREEERRQRRMQVEETRERRDWR